MPNLDRHRKYRLPAILIGLVGCFVLLSLVTLSHARGNGQTTAAVQGGIQACQVDATGRGRRIVNRFLISLNHADSRAQTGTAGLDTTDVRLLVDPADTQDCIAHNTFVELPNPQSRPESWMYFQSNQGHLFVVEILPPTPPGVIRLRWTPMIILDSTYNFLGGYMM